MGSTLVLPSWAIFSPSSVGVSLRIIGAFLIVEKRLERGSRVSCCACLELTLERAEEARMLAADLTLEPFLLVASPIEELPSGLVLPTLFDERRLLALAWSSRLLNTLVFY